MQQNDTAISVTNLRKCYNDVSVLDNVSFEVKKGTIYSLLGSNGAGKTTTVKILTTLVRPDGGNVKVNGFDVLEEPHNVRKCISLTGQYAAVDEALTGRENLMMSGRLNHIKTPAVRAGQLLSYFDLENAADRCVSTYSGGMRRKLDIAMSLVSSPKILFLDEPTTGLDPQSRRAMWSIIKSLRDTGVTIFLTTQYLEEAEQLADKIAILNEGSIIVEGTCAKLRNLLPQGLVEFNFEEEKDLQAAETLLGSYEQTADLEQRTLTVATDGSFMQAVDIFKLLDANGIGVEEFNQKRPSLEDVFLTLIQAGKAGNMTDAQFEGGNFNE